MAVASFDRLCTGITDEAGGLAKALSAVELDHPSPTCPGWTAGQLIGHLHQALSWAAGLVETRAVAFVPPANAAAGAGTGDADWTDAVDDLARRALDGFTGGDDREALSAWLLGAADRLADALRDAGPDGPVWTTFGPHRAGFWARWGALEAAVHRADAELLAGREFGPDFGLDPELSYDSVGLWLTALGDPATEPFYDPRVVNLRGSGETLLFQVVDAPSGEVGRWLVTRTPEGPRTAVAPAEGTAADVTVRGDAAALLLVLKGRIPSTTPEVTVTGDAALLDHWLANALA
ncbi:maleylpyruvate isomerase family mycothiol-dependent enzyme [Kitasatospora sp. CMC57]|uniref:Maleylpyruvate isomerase family mycothiol-dependent enzyme n=1 Tax=Kitasatospora sp. CMC57 TaxID=3231513 RepID=A0AB33K0X0_9ACTN